MSSASAPAMYLSPAIPPTDENARKELARCYELVSQRRQHYEVLLWQVPTLSLTGQAFLFTIGLAQTSSVFARVVSMLISILVSYLTGGTFAKHSLMERADRLWLERAELLLFTPNDLFGAKSEWVPNGKAHIDNAWMRGRSDIWRAPILKRSAYDNEWMVHNWIGGIRTMALCAAIVLLVAVIRPSLLT